MANLLHPRQPAGPMPAGLRDTRDALHRDAWDHDDLANYLTAITETSALVVRLRQIATGCSRPQPILEFAEQIEDAAHPIETEAMAWDDGRDDRAHRNRLDQRRALAAE